MSELPPFVLFFLAAIFVLATGGVVRKLILLATPVATVFHIWLNIDTGTLPPFSFLNIELTLLRMDKLSLPFAYLFCLF